LVRNLSGGRFFKPNLYNMAIAPCFFAAAEDPRAAIREEAKRLRSSVCMDSRLLPLHLGE
jgi:hypothetical protein